MHYLITGGCGFIGSTLAHALQRSGHKVVILDNLSSGKKENAPPNCEIIVADIHDKNALKKGLTHAQGCFHLAAIASAEKSLIDWGASHVTNMGATVQLIDTLASMKRQIPIIFASSAAVYGNPVHSPIDESHPTYALSPYGLDKLGSEKHLALAWNFLQIPSISFRLFNVYGARQNPTSTYSGVISRFIDAMMHKKTLSIFGDGMQERDFIHVDDVVAFLMQGMRQCTQNARIYNLCTETGTTINDLLHMLERLFGTNALKEYFPARQGDIRTSIGNNLSVRQDFGIKPTIPLLEGLDRLMRSI